jgi:tetratricopeptide (TPR) repeat protein
LALLATLIYSNTFFASFQYDDESNIIKNVRIRTLSDFWNDAGRQFAGSRDIGLFTFALNYSVGGLDVFGYHLVNLVIHIANGWLVYALVSLLARTPGMQPSTLVWSPERVRGVALTTALLFVAHPIQTQAVTYIVQRFTSLATLFYLLAVVCYLRWRLTDPTDRIRYAWYWSAVGATILAMKTKEISFTLPFMVLLVEGVCFRGTVRERLAALAPFLLTLPIIPLAFSGALGDTEVGLTRETTAISRLSYFATQLPVVVTYLRLLAVPIHQTLDHEYPIYSSLVDPAVALSGALLLGLLGAAIVLIVRSQNFRLSGLGLLWFFLALSVESSIIPIRDVLVEHRLYLPSVGFLLAVSGAVVGRFPRWKQAVAVTIGLVIVLLACATYQRNRVWKDEVTLWTDVVAKSPSKPRPRNNLGNAYLKQGRYPDAVREFLTAIELRPDFAEAHNNLCIVYTRQGRFDEAMTECGAAVQLSPKLAEARANLGNVYFKQGMFAAATTEFLAARQLKPEDPRVHRGLGDVYAKEGQMDQAIAEYRAALHVDPSLPDVHNSLGIVYAQQGRLDEAIGEYKTALTLDSDYAEARNNLGNAYALQGRWEEAIKETSEALRLQPDYPEAHYNLGSAYLQQGRISEAIQEFLTGLRLNPDFPEAHYNLGNAYAAEGRLADAIQEYSAALALDPKSAEAHNNLGNVYAREERFGDAIKEFAAATGLNPNLVEAHYNAGSAYARLGLMDDAIREYLIVIGLQPGHVDAHYNLANAYKLRGLPADARTHFEAALRLKPDFAPAREALESP